MNKRNINLSILAVLFAVPCVFPHCVKASDKEAGTKTAQFLKMASGARAAAMGEAFAAAAEDAFALDWNPASVTNIPYRSVAFMHSLYLADTSLSYLSYGENTGDMGSWSIAAKYMNYGSMESTDEHGLSAKDMSPFDLAVSIGFSCYVTGFNKDPEERFIMGAAGKFISSRIEDSDNTLSADLGILSPWFFGRHFRIGLSGQNLIGSMRFDKEKNDLPMILRAGTITRIGSNFAITADAIYYNDYDTVYAAGGELVLNPATTTEIAIRAGYNTRNKDEHVKGSSNISMGGGFRFNDIYSLDYSYSPFGDLGNVHRFSLSINFKRPVEIKKRRRGT